MISIAKSVIEYIDHVINPFRSIEIFGMFGAGNLGDEAMLVAASNVIPRFKSTSWKIFPNHPFLNKLACSKKRDQIIVVGGTLVHGGDSGWLDYVEMKVNQGSKISFFGTGIAFTDEQIKRRSLEYTRWQKILKSSETVCLRGAQSVQVCAGMGVAAEMFGDFAILLYDNEIPVRAHDRRDRVVGVNVGLCQGDQSAFEEQIADFISFLKNDFTIAFHAVVREDIDCINRVIKYANLENGSYYIKHNYFDPIDFMNCVKNYKAFIGLKLHAAGLAMMAGVPSIMISYLPKCHDFMSVFSEEKRQIIQDLPISSDALLSIFADMCEYPDKYIVTNEMDRLNVLQKERVKFHFNG